MGCSKYSTACARYCSFESLEIEFKPVYEFAEMGKLRFVCWSFSWEQSMSSVWLNHDGVKNHNKTSRMRLFYYIHFICGFWRQINEWNPTQIIFSYINWLTIYNIFNSLATVFRSLAARDRVKAKNFLAKKQRYSDNRMHAKVFDMNS